MSPYQIILRHMSTKPLVDHILPHLRVNPKCCALVWRRQSWIISKMPALSRLLSSASRPLMRFNHKYGRKAHPCPPVPELEVVVIGQWMAYHSTPEPKKLNTGKAGGRSAVRTGRPFVFSARLAIS